MIKAFVIGAIIVIAACRAGAALAYVSPTAHVRLDAIATIYTGELTTVVCQKKFPDFAKDASGYVQIRKVPPYDYIPVIHLRQYICDGLAEMVVQHSKNYWFPSSTERCNKAQTSCISGNFDGYNAAIDMMVLTHEATHIKLESDNECVVNMTALANLWETTRWFLIPLWAKVSLLNHAPTVVRKSPPDYQPPPGQPFSVLGCPP